MQIRYQSRKSQFTVSGPYYCILYFVLVVARSDVGGGGDGGGAPVVMVVVVMVVVVVVAVISIAMPAIGLAWGDGQGRRWTELP